MQSGNKNLAISSVPVSTNAETRESQLFSSTYQPVLKSTGAIVRAHVMYKRYVIFSSLVVVLGVLGQLPFARHAVLQVTDSLGSYLQSLLVGTLLLVTSFLSVIIGIIGDLLRTNRSLIEDTLEHFKKLRFNSGGAAAGAVPPPLTEVVVSPAKLHQPA